jgi:D-alanyl-D-alanine carboxypeptidase/D-alanyl-D-alanine-endopeptidase (penicillin-binding protein 4)
MNSLPVNKNSIIIITSPTVPGEKASVKTVPETRFITINNKTLTIEKDSNSISVLRNWPNRKNEIAVSGIIGSTSLPDTVQVNIVYPEKYLLSLFTELLKKNNIQFNGLTDTLKTPSAANLISTVTHPLTGIIKNTNKESDNLNAEMILRVMAYEKYKRKVSAADGIKMLDSLIQITGIKKGSYRIVDGSGVSFYNLISAEMIIEILKFERSKPEQYKLFLISLPVAGVDGTLKVRLKDFAHLQNINAKTGSLSGTSTIAGYINTVHGHTMAFVLLIQNFTGSPKRIRDLQDEICRAVFLIKSDKDE